MLPQLWSLLPVCWGLWEGLKLRDLRFELRIKGPGPPHDSRQVQKQGAD